MTASRATAPSGDAPDAAPASRPKAATAGLAGWAEIDLSALEHNVAGAARARPRLRSSWRWSRPTRTATAWCPCARAAARRRRDLARRGPARRGASRCATPASTRPVLAWLQAARRAAAPAAVARRHRPVGVGAPGRSTRSPRPPARPGGTARVHLKVDTGLARGGATGADWPALLDAAPAARGRGRRRGGRRLEPLRLRRRARPPDHRRAAASASPRRSPWPSGRAATRGPAPRQLRGHAHPPGGALRPGPARASRSTACRRCPIGGPATSGCARR